MKYKIAKGETIVRSRPFVYALCSDQRLQRCEVCLGALGPDRIACGQCGYVYYCSRQCQDESAWSLCHSLECDILACRPLRLMTRLITRVLLTLNAFTSIAENRGEDANRRKDNRGEEYIYGHRRDWLCLMDHYENVVRDAEAMLAFEQIYAELELIFARHSLQDKFDDARLLIQIYAKILVNSFALMPQGPCLINQIGRAVYLGPSILDHSCHPDAMFTFVGRELIVYALRDIEFDDIRTIYISYIDEFESRDERQRQLRHSYYFDCACERCTAECEACSPLPKQENAQLRMLVNEIDNLVNDHASTARLITLAQDYCVLRSSRAKLQMIRDELNTRMPARWRSETEHTIANMISEGITRLGMAHIRHCALDSATPIPVIRITDFLAQHHLDYGRMCELCSFYAHYYGSPLHPRYRAKVLLYLAYLLLRPSDRDSDENGKSIEAMYKQLSPL